MPRTNENASLFRRYVTTLNDTLNHTVSDSHLTTEGLRGGSTRSVGRFRNGVPLPLELKPSGNFLFVFQQIHLDGAKIIVEEASYRYTLSDDFGDEQAWVFRHDYVRFADDRHPHSHIQVNAKHRFSGEDLNREHFPSGRLSLEQIIAYLILERNIRPLRGTSKNQAIEYLRSKHAEFMNLRTDADVFP